MKLSVNTPLQTSFDGVKMIDLSSFTVLDSKPLSAASGVAVNEDYLYVTDSVGLHIYDISGNNLVLESTTSNGAGNYIALGN